MKLVKKAAAITLAAVMAMTVFTGCASKAEAPDPSEVVMTVGETEVKMNVANFFVRYNQSLMESLYTQYMGDNVWKTEVEKGVTYEENLKESLLEELQKFYILSNHVGDYDVKLTDDEVKAIEAAAEAFAKENKDAASNDLVSADKDTIVEYLKLYTISEKMGDAMRADVDTTVTDEQAAQKRVRYFEIAKSSQAEDGTTTTLSDDEIKDAKKEAKAFLKGAKENGSMEAYGTEKEVETKTLAFAADSTALDEEVIKAADKLKENEFSEVIETENGIYVLQLESEFDAEATESAKPAVLTKRQEDRYTELLEKWTKDTKIKVNEEVWDKISLHGLKVNNIEDEKEESEEKAEE